MLDQPEDDLEEKERENMRRLTERQRSSKRGRQRLKEIGT